MRAAIPCLVLTAALATPVGGAAQVRGDRLALPLRQSNLTAVMAEPRELTLRDASRNDRWLGLGVRDVRWAPDGAAVYFRWKQDPASDDLPEDDPWFRVDAGATGATELTAREAQVVPAERLSWSADGVRAAWGSGRSVFLYDRSHDPRTRMVAALESAVREVRLARSGREIEVEADGSLWIYHVDAGALRLFATRHEVPEPKRTAEGAWLRTEETRLFEETRARLDREARLAQADRLGDPSPVLALPVEPGETVDQIQRSPDGRFVTFRARRRAVDRPATQYIDYLDPSGYSTVHEARGKAGEPRDRFRLGIVAADASVERDSAQVTWVSFPEAEEQETVPHGPWWSLDGTRALVQLIGEDHQDLWIAELDPRTGTLRVLAHDHDDAWIGGPPVQANTLQPALLEWLPDGSFVFASERSGWSHLYRTTPDGATGALTTGDWEVRGAELSRDRTTWLIQASREHPSDDHLYTMPAGGGPLTRVTEGPGRHEGWLSPDVRRVAVVASESLQLPDLWVGTLAARRGGPSGAAAPERTRVTVSGSDAFFTYGRTRPEMVSFAHPDGGRVWAALYRPERPLPERAAVVHVHGGGYRQFAHRGWSVYGWALHVGFVNWLVQQGYTVLDVDYRGSAGFGRDYRTDIARSMGIKDTDGVVAGARWLAEAEGIDPTRIGMHGVSYGGFLTLMTLFRYPGVMSAGIARASVSDWAHYSDGWTSRILGVPHMDEDAYRRSSPIYYAEGLSDPLLITHGLVDDNVHFQDSARLIQRLIELEKRFEVMVYPIEPHTIQTEASRLDFVTRAAAFFDAHLLRR
ncbi:MAG: prolyl oligopeptidase family serine peptidase [Gemmatimonadota bacterium]